METRGDIWWKDDKAPGEVTQCCQSKMKGFLRYGSTGLRQGKWEEERGRKSEKEMEGNRRGGKGKIRVQKGNKRRMGREKEREGKDN